MHSTIGSINENIITSKKALFPVTIEIKKLKTALTLFQMNQNKQYTFQTRANYMFLTGRPGKGEELKLADPTGGQEQRWFLDTRNAIRKKQNINRNYRVLMSVCVSVCLSVCLCTR